MAEPIPFIEVELGGRYRIEELIASGGMADVFKGFDPVLHRTVAIKVLNRRLASDPRFGERFRSEARATAGLAHPNIVAVYDHGPHELGTNGHGSDGQSDASSPPFIVMEFIDGRTLADILTDGWRPSPAEAVHIAKQICDALDAAHVRGVIHRDVKPGNVMIADNGSIKVMDFGIARLVSAEATNRTTGVLGTAPYLSPEQVEGKTLDVRTDIYSLGVVLFEMLTGRLPFTGESAVEIAHKHVTDPPPLPSDVDAAIEPALDEAVTRALAKDPDRRYQTAAAFADALDRSLLDARPVRSGQTLERPSTARATATADGDQTQVITPSPKTRVLPTFVPERPPDAKGTKTSHRRQMMLAVSVLALAAAAAAFVITRAMTTSDNEAPVVTVPDVRGMTLADARVLLQEQGLRLADPIYRLEEETAPGTVIGQDIGPGTEVRSGSVITLIVAKAPSDEHGPPKDRGHGEHHGRGPPD